MSTTPRTDAAYHSAWNGPFAGEPETQAWNFARQLERELAALNVELEECKHQNGISERETLLEADLAAAKADSERLDWLEKAAEHSVSLFRNAGKTITCYINDPATEDDFAQGCGESVRAAIDAAKGDK